MSQRRCKTSGHPDSIRSKAYMSSQNYQEETASARPITVRELAQRVAGAVEGDDAALIHGVSSIEEAENGDIVFAENDRFLNRAHKSRASAIVAFLDATTPDKPLIKVD